MRHKVSSSRIADVDLSEKAKTAHFLKSKNIKDIE